MGHLGHLVDWKYKQYRLDGQITQCVKFSLDKCPKTMQQAASLPLGNIWKLSMSYSNQYSQCSQESDIGGEVGSADDQIQVAANGPNTWSLDT